MPNANKALGVSSPPITSVSWCPAIFSLPEATKQSSHALPAHPSCVRTDAAREPAARNFIGRTFRPVDRFFLCSRRREFHRAVGAAPCQAREESVCRQYEQRDAPLVGCHGRPPVRFP